MVQRSKTLGSIYIRNLMFGVEDSLVSTVGLASGIAVAGLGRSTVLLTGLVYTVVEAFAMAAGSFISEKSAEEYVARREVSSMYSLLGSAVMFFSYFISGFLSLLPYILLPLSSAFWFSIIFSLFLIFILGIAGAKLARTNMIWNGIRTALIGGAAIVLGILVGSLVK